MRSGERQTDEDQKGNEPHEDEDDLLDLDGQGDHPENEIEDVQQHAQHQAADEEGDQGADHG
jgi:hypothetical protein